MLLKGKKALITGGNSGIGKAIAECFLSHGADIAIFGSNHEKTVKAAEELSLQTKDNQAVFYRVVDIANTHDVEKNIQEIQEELTSLDILVNNAGITRDGLLLRMKEEDWNRVIDVNLKSHYNTCRVAIKSMMKKKAGKIINISSVIGLTGNSGQVNYSASKAGIIGFTKALAKEVARKNICVNSIAPGYIETQMTKELSESIKKVLLEKIPLQRLGQPKDIARAALFLASELSDYITGQVITVDGGMVL